MEASEIISDEKQGGDPHKFWSFLEQYGSTAPSPNSADAKEHEEAAVQASEGLLDKVARDVFALAINIRAGAPLVELHNSIAKTHLKGSGCGGSARVVVESKGFVCDPDKLVQTIFEDAPGDSAAAPAVETYDFDHIYPSREARADTPPKVVLYGIIGDKSFQDFHEPLVRLANDGKITYIARHAPFLAPEDAGKSPSTFLKGFGVTLDLKSMEYKALDDRVPKVDDDAANAGEEDDAADEEDLEDEVEGFVFSRLISRKPALENSLKKFREHLLASASQDSSSEIKVWDMKELGLQAAQKIMKSKNKLWKLQSIAQNFPVHAKALTKRKVKKSIKKAVRKLQKYVDPGLSGLKLNGRDVDPASDTFDVFEFLQTLREEAKFSEQFRSVGFTASQVEKYGSALHSKQDSGSVEDMIGMRVDMRKGSKGSVFFINNIQKDQQYQRWPGDMRYLMQQSWSLIQVKNNLYTMVFVLDPTTATGLAAVQSLFGIVEQNIPVRVGFAFVDSSPSAEEGAGSDAPVGVGMILKLLAAGKKDHKQAGAKSFLRALSAYHDKLPLTKEKLVAAYGQGIKEAEGSWSSTAYEEEAGKVLSSDRFDKLKGKVAKYVQSKGLLLNQYTLNGALEKGVSDLESSLMQKLFMEQQRVQRLYSMGRIAQKKNVYAFFTGSGKGSSARDAPWAYPRLHDGVMCDAEDMEFVEMPASATLAKYTEGGKLSSKGALFTLWAVADPNTDKGKAFMANALRYVANANARVAFFSSSAEMQGSTVNLEVDGASKDIVAPKCSDSFGVATGLNVAPGESLLVVNGRVFRDAADFEVSVFELIDRFERKRIAESSKTGLIKLDRFTSDNMMQITAVANRFASVSRSKFGFEGRSTKGLKKIVFRCNPDSTNRLNVVAVIDPLSDAGQRYPPILTLLRDVIGAKITIYLNPKTDISEFPLKNFFRYVGGGNDAHAATFRHMPPQHILTMKVFTPEPWVVMKKNTIDDLDNIRLDDSTMGSRTQVSAEFELKNILVTGSCQDLTHRQPPNGLQIVLDDNIDSSKKTDTLVMQNLGYFQLQAMPGVYTLRLARGRASRLYSIAPQNVATSMLSAVEDGTGVPGVSTVVRSFGGSNVRLVVRKNKGMEGRRLLAKIPSAAGEGSGDGGADDDEGDDDDYDEEYGQKGLWGKISNIFGGKGSSKGSEVSDGSEENLETLHVFSLASGHLYERLLRIMMLSVRKRTSGPIKFWLVENFLSPQFKQTIQFMASEFGFDVGLVTYKWPHWLRRQTEKQRIIWGYKILFLDVLFPLNVPKIITVDADQVVRADLRELWNMDLQGAPYGYTPFCTSREETLGYQFWRQGFWKNHLNGKPYHISALYVVDLVRFRRMAAGDQLRSIYDQLSRDPNSLANLDQDLPNYAQNQIPIFSLPQDWLWCQSWCSDSTLSTAKTIDLCNHPKTKEAKLDMARRIISGEHFEESWVELDKEVGAVITLAEKEIERTCSVGDKC
jgi:UDP-glucose:glycoprotein glucosyltransferase